MSVAVPKFGRGHAGLLLKDTVKGTHCLKSGSVSNLGNVAVGVEKLISGKIRAINVQEPFEVYTKVTVKPSG